MQMKREHQVHFWYFVVAFLAVMAIEQILGQRSDVKTIPYNEFLTLVQEHKVKDLVVGQHAITGQFATVEKGKPPKFLTHRVDPALAATLEKSGVTFSGRAEPGLFANVLAWFMPVLLFVLLWMFLIRPAATGGGLGRMGGLFAVGKSRAKIYAENDVPVRFSDVAGVDEAKAELQEIVAFLKDPKRYGRLGAHIPKGILLVGPPGTGKTLLARAVAGEAGVPFFSISGSEFVEMFVGVGAARVRDLFKQARERAPSIVFIDELDALGRARSGFMGASGGHDEKEQTLNQLLTELDGFDPSTGVVLLGATNRPEILDPALLRAGRFDRQVLVDRPDKKGRIEILRLHIRKIHLADGVSLEAIAALTPGFTGADLANLVNEAALLATRRNAEQVGFRDFEEAVERIVAGLEKPNRLLNPHERTVVAHHEMGHALVAMTLPGTDPVQKVSIIPRGLGALGYTIQRPLEDRYLMVRRELFNRIVVLLGGRAAESVIFGEISTGATDDLAKATEIARNMVVRFGMDPRLGQVTYEPQRQSMLQGPMDWQPRQYGEETATAIDDALRELVDGAYARARAILVANEKVLRESARVLLEKETLSAAEISSITGPLAPPPALPAPSEAMPAA
ncbi:MAG: ATP-dependent zinc metalloprotease FtsH [Acetobacteraceae bacterium]